MTTFPKRFLTALTLVALAAPLTLATPAPKPGSGAAQDTTARIMKQVRHELIMLPWLSIFDNLSFRVEGDRVVLLGQVTRPTLRSEAAGVVKHIAGVATVDNRIEVLPLSNFDDQVRLRTARAIYGYPGLSRYGQGTQPSIRIVVKNGDVSLEGVVNSEADRNLAGIRANGVFGSFSVTNNLRVVHG